MSKKTLSALPLKTLLERVHLGGVMSECLLDVKKGKGHIVALDMTNVVLVDVAEDLPGLEDGKYGIGKLDTLVKFLDMCKDEELSYTISDKWLTLRRQGHGKFSVLLLESDMVGTQVESDPEIKKNMSEYPYNLALKREFVDDAVGYMGLVNGQLVSFHISDKGRVILSNQSTNEIERFEATVGGVDNVKEEFEVAIYSNQLEKVLSVIRLDEKDPDPEGDEEDGRTPRKPSLIYLSKDRPVIIQQDDDNVWALTNSIA